MKNFEKKKFYIKIYSFYLVIFNFTDKRTEREAEKDLKKILGQL